MDFYYPLKLKNIKTTCSTSITFTFIATLHFLIFSCPTNRQNFLFYTHISNSPQHIFSISYFHKTILQEEKIDEKVILSGAYLFTFLGNKLIH
jgi:hypothetical protein